MIIFVNMSCQDAENKPTVTEEKPSMIKEGTFAYDLDFLKKHDSVIVLSADNNKAQVIVSAKYQAKVFTSTANGAEGTSFGWVNYKAFSGPVNEHMNGYGGENRLWLGPEGGKFSLFFNAGDSMVFNHWKTPAAFDTEAWTVKSQDNSQVAMQKEMQLTNYKGTSLQITVNRTIKILDKKEVGNAIGLLPDSSVTGVGYETKNEMVNSGKEEWTAKTGMPCIWMLDMFKPTPSTVIVVPYKNDNNDSFDKVATTNYFGEIPAERLKHQNNTIFFKADGKSRGKMGIAPTKAKNIAGSYDAQLKVLTVVIFDIDASQKYLNQEWNTTKPSFSGDAVNAYNDGPLADGSQMGPFYEIESVSPAAFLKPGKSISHAHAVFHFTGDEKGLDAIAQKLLSVSLEQIKTAL